MSADSVTAEKSNFWALEIAWDIAKKAGGIYNGIRTKAAATVDELGNRYVCVAPYSEGAVENGDVQLQEPDAALDACLSDLQILGIECLYGRWMVEGYPQIVLIDLESVARYADEGRAELWNIAQINIPEHDGVASGAMLFGYAVASLIGELQDVCQQDGLSDSQITAQFHEWQSSIGLILCHGRRYNVATIFTTHATQLGRHLCGAESNFYNELGQMMQSNVDKEMGDRGIYHTYCMERSAAALCDKFTTVSAVLGNETTHVLLRSPDAILPNGLDVQYYADKNYHNFLHELYKERIHEFVRGHFIGYLDFDLDKTLYFVNAGRYEFCNKGVDLYIEALARLNYHLKFANSDITIIAFFVFPTKTHNYNVKTLHNHWIYTRLKDLVSGSTDIVRFRTLESLLSGRNFTDAIVSPNEYHGIQECLAELNNSAMFPPITTHNMDDDGGDEILVNLRRCKLFNAPSDRVKVIFHPAYLHQGTIIGLNYDNFLFGCHLGVFPSYYEPWGYTPAECVVKGLPLITSNLSGFGNFMSDHVGNPKAFGIYIVNRTHISVEESVLQLAQYMCDYANTSASVRGQMRDRCIKLSWLLDWNHLGKFYTKVRQLAIADKSPQSSRHYLGRMKPIKEIYDKGAWSLQESSVLLLETLERLATVPSAKNLHSFSETKTQLFRQYSEISKKPFYFCSQHVMRPLLRNYCERPFVETVPRPFSCKPLQRYAASSTRAFHQYTEEGLNCRDLYAETTPRAFHQNNDAPPYQRYADSSGIFSRYSGENNVMPDSGIQPLYESEETRSLTVTSMSHPGDGTSSEDVSLNQRKLQNQDPEIIRNSLIWDSDLVQWANCFGNWMDSMLQDI